MICLKRKYIDMSKTPAESVIEKFGGHQDVANVLNCHLSRVYRWTYPIERGGTAGLIPQRHQQSLLAAAAERGIALVPSDFFPAQKPPSSGEAA